MGTENDLWKYELDPIIFLDFTGIWSLKYEEIRVLMSSANILDEYILCYFQIIYIRYTSSNMASFPH